MENIKLLTATLDGKHIGYCSQTEFLIQLGKGPKGSYRTKRSIVGNLGQAIMHYNMLNVGNGYKKRLLMPSCSKNPVVAKTISY
jgi:hypothetical protein